MELDLFTVFSHPKFVISNNCTELKHNIGLICEELTGFHTQEKSLHSQTIALIRKFKRKKNNLKGPELQGIASLCLLTINMDKTVI